MDKAVLEARKSQAEQRFAELGRQKTDINEEMIRVQGEHRILVELLDKLNNVDKGEKQDVSTTEPGRAEELTS
jgi:hypothetical protein